MGKYRIELATPAARTYESLHRLAAGDHGGAEIRSLRWVDKLIDEDLPSFPCKSGTELCGPLERVYWVSDETLHVLYEIFQIKRVIVVLAILSGPTREHHARQVDRLCAELAMAGKLKILPSGGVAHRAAAN